MTVGGSHSGLPQFCTDYSLVGTSLCGPHVTLSIAFAITVTVLLCAEQILNTIESLVHNTQYESVKNKVFQEMTGIGLLSFLTILIDAGSNGAAAVPADYLHDLHHADFVIFIMSSLYLAQISTHMFLSIHQFKTWKIGASAQIGELVSNFRESNENGFMWWFKSNDVRDQMEYKILLSLFCKKFNIRKTDFNFPAYLNESFRHYIMSLIEQSFFVRIVFGGLIALNIIRLNFSQEHSHHCNEECQATNLLIFFSCCGWALIISSIILVLISRMYEFRLLCCAGINNVSDYAKYLLDEEQADLNRAHRLFQRQTSITLNKNDLKTTLDALKHAKEETSDEADEATCFHRVKVFMLYLYVSVVQLMGKKVNRNRLGSKELVEIGIVEESSSDDSSDDSDIERGGNDINVNNSSNDLNTGPSKSSKKKRKKILNKIEEEHGIDAPGHNKLMKSMSFASLLSLKGAIKQTVGHHDHAHPDQSHSGDGSHHLDSMHDHIHSHHHQAEHPDGRSDHIHHDHHDRRNMSLMGNEHVVSHHSLQGRSFQPHISDLSNIFLFGWSSPYFYFVQAIMFLHGAYCSFYVTNFLILPSYVNEQYRAMWHIIMIIPIVLIIPLMRYIVKVSSVVKALSSIRQDTVAKVMEDDDAAEKSCQYLRLKLVDRLTTVTNNSTDDAEIKEVFTLLVEECDKEKKGYVNRSDFRYMLRKLHLHFTDARFKEVMDVIDSNFDNKLSAQELYDFTYPDHAAKEALQRRIREQAANMANSSLIVPSKRVSEKTRQSLGTSFKFLMTSFSSSAKIAITEDNGDSKLNDSSMSVPIVQSSSSAANIKKSQKPVLSTLPETNEKDLYDEKECAVDENTLLGDSRPLSKLGQSVKVGVSNSSSKLTEEQVKVLSAAATATAKLASPAPGSRKGVIAVKSSKAATPPSSSPVQGHNTSEMQLRIQNIKSKEIDGMEGINKQGSESLKIPLEGSRGSSPIDPAILPGKDLNAELIQTAVSDMTTPKQQTQKRVRLSDSSAFEASDTSTSSSLQRFNASNPSPQSIVHTHKSAHDELSSIPTAVDRQIAPDMLSTGSGNLFQSSLNSRKSNRSRASSDAASTGSDGAGSTSARVSFSVGASTEEEAVIELDDPEEDVQIF